MEILQSLINNERKDYKCFDELKKLYTFNKEFNSLVKRGVREGKIYGFPEKLWQKINEQNIRGISNFEEVFASGYNIGYCTAASKQISYSFDGTYHLCGGLLPLLKNTKNCSIGEHTWLLAGGYIYDTTLMLIIEEGYAKNLGYIEENRYNPLTNRTYCCAKEFTRDPNLRSYGKK